MIITTIAFKDMVLAYDGQMSTEDEIVSKANEKCVKTRKYLIGVAGNADLADRFIEWAKGGFAAKNKPRFKLKKGDRMEAIIIDKEGVVTYWDEDLKSLVLGKEKMYAIGTGAQYAMGAMQYGASAVEAVEVASALDMFTGGEINKIRFNKKKK